jgi:hypothetical protein
MLNRTRGVGAVSLKVAFDAFTLWKVATPRSYVRILRRIIDLFVLSFLT